MPFKLSQDEGKILVKLARNAIIHFLKTSKKIPIPNDSPLKFNEKYGVFVTLNTIRGGNEELRGCIGYPNPILPLVNATIESAINAATQDPRFPPLSIHELDEVIIEVSILTPPNLIEIKIPRDYVKEIQIGRDGLIVERGIYRGLLLPQVPIEWKWDVNEFLINCCIKAGLSPDAWVLKETKIYKFSCVIAHEVSPNGDVVVRDLEDELHNRNHS